jgi:hypothetical protein
MEDTSKEAYGSKSAVLQFLLLLLFLLIDDDDDETQVSPC